MKIGIIAWGSLIYDSAILKVVDNKWFDDGPELPIEFARVSKNKSLTLVIYPAFDNVKTYYSISDLSILETAIKNLADREGTDIENIGFINFKTGKIKSKKMETEFKKSLSIWNLAKDFDAIIWTDLNENFTAKLGTSFSLESSIKYLDSLSRENFINAKEYISKAPSQTQTRNRKALINFINKKEKQSI